MDVEAVLHQIRTRWRRFRLNKWLGSHRKEALAAALARGRDYISDTQAAASTLLLRAVSAWNSAHVEAVALGS
eukprot:9887800-Alexandrium_andersonii.AAC.1